MTPKSRQRTALAFILVFFVADVTGGLLPDWVEDDLPEEVASLDLAGERDEIERRYEGGGPLVLFHDTIDPSVAAHYDGSPGFPGGYYGGAVALESSARAGRWATDLFRWGHAPVAGAPLQGWSVGEGFWRFGTDLEGEAAYVGGTLSELVAPVIDLRSIEPLADETVDVATGVEKPLPNKPPVLGGAGSEGCQGTTANPTYCQTRASAHNATDAALPEGRRSEEIPVLDVAAALRLRHAYDFEAGFELSDGARLEVSRYDEGQGRWTDWTGIHPSGEMLRLGEDEIRARSLQDEALHEVVLRPGANQNKTAEADVYAADAIEVQADGGGNVSAGFVGGPENPPPRERPYLYQGEVASSQRTGDPWTGFAASSQGLVESVFDLSPYAGHLLRVRFVVSTASPIFDDESFTRGHMGWLIDDVQVHGAGEPGLDIVGLATPGDATVIAPGQGFTPHAVIHNRGRDPLDVEVVATLDGQTHTSSAQTSVGPFARSVVPLSSTTLTPAPGLHGLEVHAEGRADGGEDEGNASVEPSRPAYVATHRTHVIVGSGSGWQVASTQIRPLVLGEEEASEGFGRFVTRGQPIRIRASLENLDTVPHVVGLGGVDAAHIDAVAGPWDIAAAVVDPDGNVYGTTTPQMETTTLNVSRAVSGELGGNGSVQEVTWGWSGTQDARELDVRIVDGGGETVTSLGTILVETAALPVMDVDYTNPWRMEDPCARIDAWEDSQGEQRQGAIQCTGEGPIVTPTSTVLGIDLVRSKVSSVAADYVGGPFQATLQFNATPAPSGTPPADADWTNVSTVQFDHSSSWNNTRHPFAALPDGISGWLRVNITTSQEADSLTIDRVSFDLNIQDENGISATIPLAAADFDVTLGEEQAVVGATSSTGLAVLEAKGILPSQDLCAQGISSNPDDDCIRIDQGDLHPPTCPVGPIGGSCTSTGPVWSGRVIEDGSLSPERLVDLRSVGRPLLTFKHWFSTGWHGTAYVEAATTPRDPWNHDASPVTASAEEIRPRVSEGDWKVLAAYRGDVSGTTVQPGQVSLNAFAGEEVFLRFRYHIDPGILVEKGADAGAAWAIEDIQVTGWGPNGTIPVHAAAPGFADYRIRGGHHEPESYRFAPETACWSLQDESGLSSSGCSADLVTDGMTITRMLNPVLTLRHSGQGDCLFRGADLLYQFRGADGTWPTTWRSATDGIHTRPLTDPVSGKPHPFPFDSFQLGEGPCPDDIRSSQRQLEFTDEEVLFDLEPLQSEESEVRFKLVRTPRPEHEDIVPLEEWVVHGLSVAELRHIVDAGVSEITSSEDDRSSFELRAPELASDLVAGDAILLGNDLATVAVNVTNAGSIPVEVEVLLEGIPLDDGAMAEPLDLTWIRVEGNRHITTGLTTGRASIDPGTSRDVLFRADLTDRPPGEYRFSARANVLDGIDTNPRNDIDTRNVRLLPLRGLTLDPTRSAVTPFATGPERPRDVGVTLVNAGNVDERNITVAAEVVQMTGLFTFTSFDPPLQLPAQNGIQLPRRGNSVEVEWTVDDAVLPPGVSARELFHPGNKYAVRVDVAARDGSALRWWGTNTERQQTLLEHPAGLLVNITRPLVASCGCMLLPFLAEEILYETDLTAANSTTALEEAFPLDSDAAVLEGWAATAYVEGEPIAPDERTDLPRFSVVEATDVGEAVQGEESGNIWGLPEYAGRENLRHELISPALPTHVVDATSRAILAMRYASDSPEDQVILETRRQLGGSWTEWKPVDELRSRRVAVVLSPDFPNAIAASISNVTASYDLALEDHPIPPFYENPGGLDYIDPVDRTCIPEGGSFCTWSPPAGFVSPRNAPWHQALNETLLRLAQAFSDSDVSVFSTLGPDLLDGIAEGSDPIYTLPDGEGRTLRFPIRPLEELGLRLDTYGGILLLGDNATTTFANESPTLSGMAYQPADWGWPNRVPSSLSLEHHENLFAILRAAPEAGVSVIGSLGPAAATLARSGIAQDATLALWQTTPKMPQTGLEAKRCAGQHPIHPQPRERCSDPNAPATDDPDNDVNWPPEKGNYMYVSPYDAQSLALRDLVRAGGAKIHQQAAFTIVGGPQGPIHGNGGCIDEPRHPRLVPSGSTFRCTIYHATAYTPLRNGRLHIASAARPEDAGAWTSDIIGLLSTNTGSLPPTGDVWGTLPTRLSFPVGGEFWRSEDGTDRFDGAPVQLRIVVESRDEAGGHGAFHLDRIGVLGTPREKGIGVRFVEPRADQPILPGGAFVPRMEFSNRGTTRTESTQATLLLQQWLRDVPGECGVPPVEPFALEVPTLSAGEVREIAIEPPLYPEGYNGGFFPHGTNCPPKNEVDNAFNFTLALAYADEHQNFWEQGVPFPRDDDPFDDRSTVTAFGREVIDAIKIVRTAISPSESPVDSTDSLDIQIDVENLGTQTQPVRLDLRMDYARPMPCKNETLSEGFFHACDQLGRRAQAIPLPEPSRIVSVPRGQTTSTTFSIDPSSLDDEGLAAGVYRLTIQTSTSGSAIPPNQITLPPITRWIHLAADEDIETAREIHPPDGAWALDYSDLSHLEPPLNTTPPGTQWDPSGFSVQAPSWPTPSGASRSHDGRYGPDGATLDGQGQGIAHGWRIIRPCDGQPCTHPSMETVAEWRRDGEPSYREGQDPPQWDQSDGDEAELGFQDLGPDALLWHPHDVSDKASQVEAPDRSPYLTLASFERPSLSFLSRYEATENTGLVVQLQLARRACSYSGSAGATCESSGWLWDTPWLTLPPSSGSASTLEIDSAAVTAAQRRVGTPPAEQVIPTWERNMPSNPLAGQTGFWNGSSGLHAEDDGWQRIDVPIALDTMSGYCRSIATTLGALSGIDLCRFAHANGGVSEDPFREFASRPVRFRFAAASYGGDVGPSFWQIADVALTEHQISFVGPHTFSVAMPDASTRDVVVRVQNDGVVDDDVIVTATPPPGRSAIFPGPGSVTLSLHPSFENASDAVQLHLKPGESRVIWVRLSTGIYSHLHPGTSAPIPFIVQAESIRDPLADARILVDASVKARAWPDLEARGLVLDEDNENDLFRTAERVPVKPFLVVRNAGELPIGGASEPIVARLVEERINTSTGEPVPGSKRIVSTLVRDEPLAPFRDTAQDLFLPFDEWVPEAVGTYDLQVDVNPPDLRDQGLLVLPERDPTNNQFTRRIAVGPVEFADLHVVDAWLVPFDGACGNTRVKHAVAGHTYCLAAAIENRGRHGALLPSVAFGVKGGAPFSAGAPPLSDRFEDNVFPGRDEAEAPPSVVVLSSPRLLTLRSDGGNMWDFFIDVTSQSVFPNFENKTRDLQVTVNQYRLLVADAPPTAGIAPGETLDVTFNVTNNGNAPVTPTGIIEGDDRVLRMHLGQPPTIGPGETIPVRLSVNAAQSIRDLGEQLPTVRLSSLEDPFVDVPLPTVFQVAASQPVTAHALPATVSVGPGSVEGMLDASRSPVPLQWRLVGVSGPLEVATSWNVSTRPFEIRPFVIPVQVSASAPPGDHGVDLHFEATESGIARTVDVPVDLTIMPTAGLQAHLEEDVVRVPRGAEAAFVAHLDNQGNLPLSVVLSHAAEHGQILQGDETLFLRPDETRNVTIKILGGQADRLLGTTAVAWGGNGSPVDGETIELDWTVDYIDQRVTITDSDIADLRAQPGDSAEVRVRVANPTGTLVQAEAKAFLDGELHGRVVLGLAAGEEREARIPFHLGGGDAPKTLVVVVHPVGTTADIQSPEFYRVGATVSGRIEREDDSLPIPSPSLWMLLVLLAAAFMVVKPR